MRIYGHNRRFLVQGPGKSFTVGAVDLEDAQLYVDQMEDDEWVLWRFCGGKTTIREMTQEEIEKDRIDDMFRT
jgi:hypothetical protein